MTTQIDWHEELDSSFGSGADRPPTVYLVPARAALRKRRTAMGAAALVSVIIVGGIGWALAPGGSSRAIDDQVATSSASPTPSPAKPTQLGPHVAIHRVTDAELDQTIGDQWAELSGEVLNIAPDAEVGDWTANPMGYRLPNNSVGIQVFRGGVERWMLLTAGANGAGFSVWDPPGKRFATFQDWLASTVAFQHGQEEASPVSFLDGQLVPQANVEILGQVLAPPEAAAYGPIEDAAAVEVRLPSGEIRFALVHQGGDSTVVDPAVLDAPTMSSFLAHLQAQGDGGEGLR